MMNPTDVVAGLAGLVALAAGVAAWPRPVDMDGARGFAALWRRRLLTLGVQGPALASVAPYHPLGRRLERKLARPGIDSLPGAPLPGEAELLQDLAGQPRHERWAWLMHGPGGAVARAAVQATWDDTHGVLDPARWLGPALDWQAVGERPAAVAEQALKRLRAAWVWVPGSGTAPCLVPPVPSPSPQVVWSADGTGVWSWGPLPEALRGLIELATAQGADPVAPWILELVADLMALAGAWLRAWSTAVLADGLLQAEVPDSEPHTRLLVAGEAGGAVVLLEALLDSPALRDRVLAVTSVGGWLGGWPDELGPWGEASRRDHLAAWFRHGALDVEVVRQVPYASLAWVSPDTAAQGVLGAIQPGGGVLPVAAQRWPEPGVVGREAEVIWPVDLGVLPADLSAELIAEVAHVLRVSVALLTVRCTSG